MGIRNICKGYKDVNENNEKENIEYYQEGVTVIPEITHV